MEGQSPSDGSKASVWTEIQWPCLWLTRKPGCFCTEDSVWPRGGAQLFQVLFACLLSPQRLWVLGSGAPVLLHRGSGSLQGAELHGWVCVRPQKPGRSAFLPDCPHQPPRDWLGVRALHTPASSPFQPVRSAQPSLAFQTAWSGLRRAPVVLPRTAAPPGRNVPRGGTRSCGWPRRTRHCRETWWPSPLRCCWRTGWWLRSCLSCFCNCRLNWSTVPPMLDRF